MTRTHHHLVAGYDGSKAAAAAVSWAAEEALRRSAGLTVIACYTLPVVTDFGISAAALVVADREALREHTEERVNALVAHLSEQHPELPVNAVALPGTARQVLTEQAEHADLLVVGATGAGEVTSLLLGSVAFHVARSSPCPVAVVPIERPAETYGRVVVAIDALDTSQSALDVAIDEADLRRARLRVIHAWEYPYGAETPAAGSRDSMEVDAALELERAAQYARDRVGGDVEPVIVEGDPADEIVARAHDADVIVIGNRGRGTLRTLLLGSVSHAVLANAPCPTIVVPRSATTA